MGKDLGGLEVLGIEVCLNAMSTVCRAIALRRLFEGSLDITLPAVEVQQFQRVYVGIWDILGP